MIIAITQEPSFDNFYAALYIMPSWYPKSLHRRERGKNIRRQCMDDKSDVIMVVGSGYAKKSSREVEMVVGRKYQVPPANPSKKKHRDRVCVLLDIIPISESHPMDLVAKVRFMDNNRIGRVDLSDLVPSE